MKKTNKVFRLNAFILLVFIMTFGFAFNANAEELPQGTENIKITYLNANDEVLTVQEVEAGSSPKLLTQVESGLDYQLPDANYRIVFDGWDKTRDDLRNIQSDVTVRPTYARKSLTLFTVNLPEELDNKTVFITNNGVYINDKFGKEEYIKEINGFALTEDGESVNLDDYVNYETAVNKGKFYVSNNNIPGVTLSVVTEEDQPVLVVETQKDTFKASLAANDIDWYQIKRYAYYQWNNNHSLITYGRVSWTKVVYNPPLDLAETPADEAGLPINNETVPVAPSNTPVIHEITPVIPESDPVVSPEAPAKADEATVENVIVPNNNAVETEETPVIEPGVSENTVLGASPVEAMENNMVAANTEVIKTAANVRTSSNVNDSTEVLGAKYKKEDAFQINANAFPIENMMVISILLLIALLAFIIRKVARKSLQDG